MIGWVSGGLRWLSVVLVQMGLQSFWVLKNGLLAALDMLSTSCGQSCKVTEPAYCTHALVTAWYAASFTSPSPGGSLSFPSHILYAVSTSHFGNLPVDWVASLPLSFS
jgi:hypothetical protein